MMVLTFQDSYERNDHRNYKLDARYITHDFNLPRLLSLMKLSEIKNALRAEVICGHDQMEVNISGGGAADLMEDVLAAVAKGAVLLTGLTNNQVLSTAQIAGVLAIVIVRGKRPDANFIQSAISYGIPVLTTRYSLFVACGKLYMEGLRGLDGSW